MIYFASMTGNVRRFIGKVGLPAEELKPGMIVDKPYVLVTYTFGFGDVPAPVKDFLDGNGDLLRAVAVSGNRNWGANFGRAGDIISQEFGVPLLHKFELGGTEEDVEIFKRKAEIYCDTSL